MDGAKWMRDPLGPPFQTNLVWGQRFIQTSLSLCSRMENIQATTVPVDLHHCPSLKKPKKDCAEQDYKLYRETQKKTKLSIVGAQRISALRKGLDLDGHSEKRLVVSVDGSYTNESVLKKLDKNVTLIGRIRKDCRLYELPDCSETNEKGGKRVYGRELPTPEQIRQSQDYEWKEVKAWAAGKVHTFPVKTVDTVRWRNLINQFRAINWTDSVKINFSDFVTMENKQRSTKNNPIHVLSNLFYARN
ncbi:hypothetical protein [Lunatibacter salilacus]|uniref:hypothetical protein n=1 Tax=Lunatibacter salilacus TaxID=2483804 RepID=UPI00131E9760|nr:hypothetical protein [Lunatibacter salilacus]